MATVAPGGPLEHRAGASASRRCGGEDVASLVTDAQANADRGATVAMSAGPPARLLHVRTPGGCSTGHCSSAPRLHVVRAYAMRRGS